MRIFLSITFITMIFIGLFPFNFLPENDVQWGSNGKGLSFNGAGISHTELKEPLRLEKTVSLQLLIREPHGSKNWGPKEIFSLYDEMGSPALLVGQWDRKIFLYSRYERNEGKRWYKLFRTEHPILRGKDNLITVTFDQHKKTIYVNGQLSREKKVRLKEKGDISFSGNLVIGNSPRGKNGWQGEIKGLAIYNRTLSPEEIQIQRKEILNIGIDGLSNTRSCIGVYPFDDEKGNLARNIVNETEYFYIPKRLNAIALSMFNVSYNEMRLIGSNKSDFLKNIVFFIPFGFFLSITIKKQFQKGSFATFIIVIIIGGTLSFSIESLQLVLPSRSPDILDIFANILGSGIGTLYAFTGQF